MMQASHYYICKDSQAQEVVVVAVAVATAVVPAATGSRPGPQRPTPQQPRTGGKGRAGEEAEKHPYLKSSHSI